MKTRTQRGGEETYFRSSQQPSANPIHSSVRWMVVQAGLISQVTTPQIYLQTIINRYDSQITIPDKLNPTLFGARQQQQQKESN